MKAFFKQDEYESELSEKVKAMDFHSQMFKDFAEQEAFHTTQETLREVRMMKSQRKIGDRMIVQQIAHSHSEANLRHLNMTDLIRAESKSSQKKAQSAQDATSQQLKADQHRLEALIKTKFAYQESKNDALMVEIRRVVKEFLSSNGRIDPHTNDGWCLRSRPWTKID